MFLPLPRPVPLECESDDGGLGPSLPLSALITCLVFVTFRVSVAADTGLTQLPEFC